MDNGAELSIKSNPLIQASPLVEDNNVKPEATPLFERGGSKNRASERYPVPNKKLAKEQQKQLEEDKENFITPTGTTVNK